MSPRICSLRTCPDRSIAGGLGETVDEVAEEAVDEVVEEAVDEVAEEAVDKEAKEAAEEVAEERAEEDLCEDWERCVEGQLFLPATARVPSEDVMCWGPKCAGHPCWSVGPADVRDLVGHDCWVDGVGTTVSTADAVLPVSLPGLESQSGMWRPAPSESFKSSSLFLGLPPFQAVCVELTISLSSVVFMDCLEVKCGKFDDAESCLEPLGLDLFFLSVGSVVECVVREAVFFELFFIEDLVVAGAGLALVVADDSFEELYSFGVEPSDAATGFLLFRYLL